MLCLHAGGVLVQERESLRSIPTPKPQGRHYPIPHYELASTAVERANALGLAVDKEQWAVSKNGQRLYGVLNFKPNPKISLPDGMCPSMGLRSSHDKSLAINCCVGAKVFVCDNGAFHGDFSLRKLHTTGFRLKIEIDGVFKRFSESVGALGEMVAKLKDRRLTDNQAKVVLVDAFRADVMPWTYLRDVQQEYFEPKHDAFKPRNAWSLYNAFTEIVKERSPNDQIRTFRALNKFLAADLN